MIYVADTNVFSAYLRGKSRSLTARMQAAAAAGEVVISVMVLAELEYGARNAERTLGTTRFAERLTQLRTVLPIEPLGPEFAAAYARVRDTLESEGRGIGDRDTIIVAHALTLGATLVTANTGEFARVPGLVVENWEQG